MSGKKPVRVLQGFASLGLGGAEQMIMNAYRAIDRSLVQFDFVVNANEEGYAHEGEIRSLGGRVFHLPDPKKDGLLKFRAAWRDLLREHPEWRILHAHHTSTLILYLDIVRSAGLKTIAHSHSSGVQRGLKAQAKRATRFPLRYLVDERFACSADAGEWMFGRRGAEVLPNAIDIESFKFDEGKRQSVRDELGLTSEIVIGHVGRFDEGKNHRFIVQVFEEFLALQPRAKLLLIGKGALEDDIRKLVSSRGLVDSVQLLGARRDVHALMSGMDLFLFPSLFEGLPVVLVEAQAAGLPTLISDTITTEVDLTPAIVRESLANPAERWARRLEAILSARTMDRAELSRSVAKSEYNIDSTVARLTEIYLNSFGAGA